MPTIIQGLRDPRFDAIGAGATKFGQNLGKHIESSKIKDMFKNAIDSGGDLEAAFEKILPLNPELAETLYSTGKKKQLRARMQPLFRKVEGIIGAEEGDIKDLETAKFSMDIFNAQEDRKAKMAAAAKPKGTPAKRTVAGYNLPPEVLGERPPGGQYDVLYQGQTPVQILRPNVSQGISLKNIRSQASQAFEQTHNFWLSDNAFAGLEELKTSTARSAAQLISEDVYDMSPGVSPKRIAHNTQVVLRRYGAMILDASTQDVADSTKKVKSTEAVEAVMKTIHGYVTNQKFSPKTVEAIMAYLTEFAMETAGIDLNSDRYLKLSALTDAGFRGPLL